MKNSIIILPIISFLITILILFLLIYNWSIVPLLFIIFSIVSAVFTIRCLNIKNGNSNEYKLTLNLCLAVIIMSVFALAFLFLINILNYLT